MSLNSVIEVLLELVLSSRQPAWRVVVFCAGVVGLHLA
tara:strand:- start:426 stop:539 length:114 start_codon:yes stop_codon:yes gene_type:complete